MTKHNTWDDTLRRAVNSGHFPGVFNRVLVFGFPRTGKSSLPATLFGSAGVERITFHRQQPVDDLIGGYGLVDGRTIWLDGPVIRAMRNGTKAVCDEIDRHSAEQYSFVLAMLDDPAAISLPTGERVNAAQGYGVIATTNELPSSLPDALRDRFDLILKADTLSKPLQEALGDFAKPAQACVGRGSDRGYKDWKREGSVNLFIVASKLRRAGLADDHIAEALGLVGQEAADFLTALTCK